MRSMDHPRQAPSFIGRHAGVGKQQEISCPWPWDELDEGLGGAGFGRLPRGGLDWRTTRCRQIGGAVRRGLRPIEHGTFICAGFRAAVEVLVHGISLVEDDFRCQGHRLCFRPRRRSASPARPFARLFDGRLTDLFAPPIAATPLDNRGPVAVFKPEAYARQSIGNRRLCCLLAVGLPQVQLCDQLARGSGQNGARNRHEKYFRLCRLNCIYHRPRCRRAAFQWRHAHSA